MPPFPLPPQGWVEWAQVIGALLAFLGLIAVIVFGVLQWRKREQSTQRSGIEVHGGISHSTLSTLQAGSDIDQSGSIYNMQAKNITINNYQYGSTKSPPLLGEATIDKRVPEVKDASIALHEQLTDLAREEMGIETDGGAGLAIYLLKYAEAHRQATPSDYDALQTHLNYILAAMDWCHSEMLRRTANSKTAADILLKIFGAIDGFLEVRGFWNERVKYGRIALEATSQPEPQ